MRLEAIETLGAAPAQLFVILPLVHYLILEASWKKTII